MAGHSRSLPLMADPHLGQTMWFVKARALTAQAYVEDESWEQENLADALLEDTAMTGGASARYVWIVQF